MIQRTFFPGLFLCFRTWDWKLKCNKPESCCSFSFLRRNLEMQHPTASAQVILKAIYDLLFSAWVKCLHSMWNIGGRVSALSMEMFVFPLVYICFAFQNVKSVSVLLWKVKHFLKTFPWSFILSHGICIAYNIPVEEIICFCVPSPYGGIIPA